MGCGQSAVADDEDSWDDFCTEAEVTKYFSSRHLYRPEERFAREGYRAYAYKGARLALFVKHKMQHQELLEQQRAEVLEYEQYLKLQEKFK